MPSRTPMPASVATDAETNKCRCQAKFLTSHHVLMHRVIFYIPNTVYKTDYKGLGFRV